MSYSKNRMRGGVRKFTASLVSIGLLASGFTCLSGVNEAVADPALPYQDTALPFSVRAADLVSRMTLTEKYQQFKAERQYNAGVAPAIARLGVGAYNYWNEAMHGIAHAGGSGINKGGVATEFPSPIAMGASWNRSLVLLAGDIVSEEGRAMTNFDNAGNASARAPHKGLTYWTPTINMARDPRWGRTEESYSEDPYLMAEMAGQYVDGLQGDDPKYLKAAATPKHYLANDSENDRHWGSSNLTEKSLREYYTPAFADLLGKHQAGSVMTSYNSITVKDAPSYVKVNGLPDSEAEVGVPVSASRYALETLARRTWGFTGVVVSDCGAIGDVYNNHAWVAPGDTTTTPNAKAVAWTLKAGMDIACSGGEYANAPGLPSAITAGNVTEGDIDVALTRMFTIRMQTGEFDPAEDVPWRDPIAYNIDTNNPKDPTHQAAALSVADESVVLLKNGIVKGKNALPLTGTDTNKVVIVGPVAQFSIHGNYSPTSRVFEIAPVVALTNAIKEANPSAQVSYITGMNGNPTWASPTSGATAGDWAKRKPSLGNNVSAGNPALIRFLNDADEELGKVTPYQMVSQEDLAGWTTQGRVTATTATVGANSNAWGGYFGVKVDIPVGTTQIELREQNAGNAVLQQGFFDVRIGSLTAPDVVATLPGDGGTQSYQRTAWTGPVGEQKLYFTYRNEYFKPDLGVGVDRNVDPATHAVSPNGIDDAQEIADADTVIVYVGSLCSNNQTQPTLSGNPSDGQEESDRGSDQLGRGQDDLIKEVSALNPHTIAYMATTNLVSVEKFKNTASAMLWTAYNGQSQSDVIGRTLLGKVNPSGKLPFTWYSNVLQLPGPLDYTLTPTDGLKGRTYQYFTGDVTYPFGHGLSYTSFEYSNLSIDKLAVTPNDTIVASVDVKNAGAVVGKEVVELYVTSPDASNPLTANQQLKGFTKVSIAPGATERVSISLKAADLWTWDSALEHKVFAPGTWTLRVAPSSDVATGLSRTFTLSGNISDGLDVVATVPDGVVLDARAADSVIHANLSATKNDQSFYNLYDVEVAYSSSNPAAAVVDAKGAVKPVAAGVAEITATVTADGLTKKSSFPVVVIDGPIAATTPAAGSVIGEYSLNFGDITVPQTLVVDDGTSIAPGLNLSGLAEMIPNPGGNASYTYQIALAEANSAGATIDASGLLKATSVGTARVTVVATNTEAGVSLSHTATITVKAMTALETRTSELHSSITSGALSVDDYTVSSWAVLTDALAAADVVVESGDTRPQATDPVLADLNAAVAALVARGDSTPLTTLVSLVDAISSISSNYTQASWDALLAAVATAQGYVSNPVDVSAAQTAAAAKAIEDAIAALVIDPNLQAPAALADLVSVTNGATLVADDYTSASWGAFQSAKANAVNILALTPVNTAKAAAARTALDEAFRGLTPRVSTLALAATVQAAEATVTEGYTAASVTALKAAIASAKALLNGNLDTVTVAQIDTANAAVQDAIKGLVVDPNANAPAALAASVAAVNGANLVSGNYTSASWSALQSALATANSVLAVTPVNLAQAAAAQTTLDSAFRGLAERVSTVSVSAAIAAAQATPLENYTAVSVAVLTNAIASANALLAVNPDTVTANQVTTATNAIHNALAALTADSNVSASAALSSLATAVQSANLVAGEYSSATWGALQAALANANAVLAASPVDRAKAAAAQTALDAAFKGLAPRVSLASLSAAIQVAESLLTGDYTPASAAALTAAIASAKALLTDNPDAVTSAQVAAANAAIQTALAGLKVKEPVIITPLPDEEKTVVIIGVKPKIKGTVKVGKQLSINKGTWSPSGLKFTYKWYANGKAIKGATKSKLSLKKAQLKKKITVKVTASKAGSKSVTKTSKATKKVTNK